MPAQNRTRKCYICQSIHLRNTYYAENNTASVERSFILKCPALVNRKGTIYLATNVGQGLYEDITYQISLNPCNTTITRSRQYYPNFSNEKTKAKPLNQSITVKPSPLSTVHAPFFSCHPKCHRLFNEDTSNIRGEGINKYPRWF